MGVWGTGIMDNDLVQDAKIAFEDLVDARLSVERAVQRVKQQYRSSLDDVDEHPILILALAKLSLEQGEIFEFDGPMEEIENDALLKGGLVRRIDGDDDKLFMAFATAFEFSITSARTGLPLIAGLTAFDATYV